MGRDPDKAQEREPERERQRAGDAGLGRIEKQLKQ